jgi:hypothetical protein
VHFVDAVYGTVRQSIQVSSGMNEASFLACCSQARCAVVVRGMRIGARTNNRKKGDWEQNGLMKCLAHSSLDALFGSQR